MKTEIELKYSDWVHSFYVGPDCKDFKVAYYAFLKKYGFYKINRRLKHIDTDNQIVLLQFDDEISRSAFIMEVMPFFREKYDI